MALTWWIDAALLHRVADGSDHGVRLAAILTYVGVTDSYTLARACGITALVFLYAAAVLGLSVSAGSRRGAGIPTFVHRGLGLVALGLVAAHAIVPYLSVDPPYGGWQTGFVPFRQPVSWGIRAASWESLGILSFYLMIVTGPTVYLIGHRRQFWVWLHRLTAVMYGFAVAHVFLLGTDFIVRGAARDAVLGAQVPLLLLAGFRLAPRRGSSRRIIGGGALRWAAASVMALASAAMAALTVAVAAGDYSPGMRL